MEEPMPIYEEYPDMRYHDEWEQSDAQFNKSDNIPFRYPDETMTEYLDRTCKKRFVSRSVDNLKTLNNLELVQQLESNPLE